MLEIKIICEPGELAAHLSAISNLAPPIQASPPKSLGAVWREDDSAEPVAESPQAGDSTTYSQPPAGPPAVLTEKPSELNPAAETRRRGRPPKTEAPSAPAPAISTGEERVDPRDLADEKAEADAKATTKLTHGDIRKAIKAYGDKHGVPAAVRDMPKILGSSVSDIPDDPHALKTALAKIEAATAQPVATETAPVTKAEEKAESLFGDEPATETPAAPFTATRDMILEICEKYSRKFDPSAPDWQKSKVLVEDTQKILRQEFSDHAVNTLGAVAQMQGDKAVNFGRAYRAMEKAIQNNPFNRRA